MDIEIFGNEKITHDCDSIGEVSLETGELYVPKEETVYYIKTVFLVFSLIWSILIVSNKFYNNSACWVLVLPYIIFLLGFINAEDVADDKISEDVFSTSFVGIGIIVSLPLLTLFNKDKTDVELNHVIFMGLISILLSYFHIWCDYSRRHVVKSIRSCLETFAIDLYIFAILIFFLQKTDDKKNETEPIKKNLHK